MVYQFPVRSSEDGVVSVAAFDFDGTCIQGDSPVMLVRYLLKHGLMSKRAAFRILLWAGRYKFPASPKREPGPRAGIQRF